jgi:hypothetical protein
MDPVSIFDVARFLPLLIPIVIVVFLVIVGVILVIAFRGTGVLGQLSRALAAGVASPQQIEVERIGVMGEATVLDCNELESVAKNRTMVYHMAALVLEVRLPGVAPYRAPCRQWFIGSKWMHISEGTVVPVRVDPRNAQIVFVDLAAMDRARENAEIAKREAHARRQAELLGMNRR